MQDEGNPGTKGDDEPRRGPRSGAFADLFERVFSDDNSLKDQFDKNARALAHAALTRLDVVSREEFDSQAEVLRRTRERVEALEAELERLTGLLEAAESGGDST